MNFKNQYTRVTQLMLKEKGSNDMWPNKSWDLNISIREVLHDFDLEDFTDSSSKK
jgi:hypothetical protein